MQEVIFVNWIEMLFGIDPDLGSGALELLISGAAVLAVVGLVASRIRARSAKRA